MHHHKGGAAVVIIQVSGLQAGQLEQQQLAMLAGRLREETRRLLPNVPMAEIFVRFPVDLLSHEFGTAGISVVVLWRKEDQADASSTNTALGLVIANAVRDYIPKVSVGAICQSVRSFMGGHSLYYPTPEAAPTTP